MKPKLEKQKLKNAIHSLLKYFQRTEGELDNFLDDPHPGNDMLDAILLHYQLFDGPSPEDFMKKYAKNDEHFDLLMDTWHEYLKPSLT